MSTFGPLEGSYHNMYLVFFSCYGAKQIEIRSIYSGLFTYTQTEKKKSWRWENGLNYTGYDTGQEMKVKSDHRSKFSNLSNWKEEA